MPRMRLSCLVPVAIFLSALPVAPSSAWTDLSGGASSPVNQSPLPGSGGMCLANPGGNPGTTDACTDDPAALPQDAPSAAVGNPVNVMSGNKFESETDLPALPGALGLQLSRSYNSQSRQSGLFGFGWRHAYEVALMETADRIQIVQADGRRLIFPRTAGAGCAAANPADGRVERTAQGWVWRWPSGRELVFEPAGRPDIGRLAMIRDASLPGKPFVSLRYGLHGELSAIRDSLGREARFRRDRYGAQGWPEIRVETPVGVFRYRLDGEDNLVLAGRPDGSWIGYVYESSRNGGDSHNLTGRFLWDVRARQWQRQAAWAYDTADRAILSEHAGGVERVILHYDPAVAGRPRAARGQGPEFVTRLVNSLGQTTAYRWQLQGQDYRLLEARGPGCATCGEVNRRFAYTAEGRLRREDWLGTDGRSYRALIRDYDGQGRLSGLRRLAAGRPERSETFRHDDSAHPDRLTAWERPSVWPGHRAVTEYRYGPDGRLERVVESGYTPAGEVLHRERTVAAISSAAGLDAHGLLADIALPNGNRLHLVRDGVGRLARIEHRSTAGILSNTFLLTYSPLGRLTQAVFQPGRGKPPVVWRYPADGTGRPLGVWRDGKPERVLRYDAAGRIEATADRMRGVSRWMRDDESRPEVLQQLDARGYRETGFRYDDQGRLSALLDGEGRGPRLGYSEDGRTVAIRDILGREQRRRLAGDGSLREILRLPAPGEWWSVPDGVRIDEAVGERLVRRSDGAATRWTWDDWGRPATREESGQGSTRYGYDNADRLVAIDKPDGTHITLGYDAAGHRASRTVRGIRKDGARETPFAEITRWRWRGDDLVAIEHPAQTTVFRYDTAHRLIAREERLAGLTTPYVTRYDYTGDRVTAVTLPEGVTLNRDRPDEVRLHWPLPDMSHPVVSVARDEAGRPEYVLGNGLHLQYRYDAAGRWQGARLAQPGEPGVGGLIRLAAAAGPAVLWEESWRHDPAGRLQAGEQRTTGQHVMWRAFMDSRDHLLQYTEQPAVVAARADAGDPARFFRYAYDASGNRRMAQEAAGPTDSLFYEEGRLRSRGRSGPDITYDDAGQPLQYGNLDPVWENGRMVRVYRRFGDERRLLADYCYNSLGQRVRKTVYLDQAGQRLPTPRVSAYLYDGNRLSQELDARGRILRSYVYLGVTPFMTLDYGRTGIVPLSDDGWVARARHAAAYRWAIWRGQAEAPAARFIQTDHTGMPRLVTDDRGNPIWRLETTPFGQAREWSRTGYRLALRFPGQFADEETGLHENRYRYYDPAVGRYLTPDPLGRRGGENLYGYVNQAPHQYADPLGLLLFAFDGTGNQDYFNTPDEVNTLFHRGESDDQRYSNVVRFRDAYLGDPDEPEIHTKQISVRAPDDPDLPPPAPADWPFSHAYYISGAGTRDQYTGISGSVFDAGNGASMPDRVDMMVTYLTNYLNDLSAARAADAERVEIPIDVVGFSRGATEARMFANAAVETLKQGNQLGALASKGICVKFRFIGLWDTVPHYGLSTDNDLQELKLGIPDEFIYAAQAVAMNEHRGGFAAVSIFKNPEEAEKITNPEDIRKKGATRIERGFLGAHSDIGGGYSEGDLSDVALMWMIQQAENAGVSFDDGVIERNRWDVVENPVVHDSVGVNVAPGVFFGPGRVMKYMDGKTKVSQFDVKNMGMTWEDTVGFQSQDLKRLILAQKKLEADFFKDPDCVSSFAALNDVDWSRCLPFDEFYSRKELGVATNSGDKPKDRTVLYRLGNEDAVKYADWLSTQYQIRVGVMAGGS